MWPLGKRAGPHSKQQSRRGDQPRRLCLVAHTRRVCSHGVVWVSDRLRGLARSNGGRSKRCNLSLRRDGRLVRAARRREISKENNARAYDYRYNEQRNQIFLPGWPERNLGHTVGVYGLRAFNQ